MMILERMHSMLKWNIKGHRYCGSNARFPCVFCLFIEFNTVSRDGCQLVDFDWISRSLEVETNPSRFRPFLITVIIAISSSTRQAVFLDCDAYFRPCMQLQMQMTCIPHPHCDLMTAWGAYSNHICLILRSFYVRS